MVSKEVPDEGLSQTCCWHQLILSNSKNSGHSDGGSFFSAIYQLLLAASSNILQLGLYISHISLTLFSIITTNLPQTIKDDTNVMSLHNHLNCNELCIEFKLEMESLMTADCPCAHLCM